MPQPRQTPYSRQLLTQVSGQRAAMMTTESHVAAATRGAFASVRASVGAPLAAVVDAYGNALSAAQEAGKTSVGRQALRQGVGSIGRHAELVSASERLQASAQGALGAFAGAATTHITQGQRQAVRQATGDAQANILLSAGHHAHQLLVAGAVKAARQAALDQLIGRSQRGGRLGDLLSRLVKDASDRLLERLMQALDTGMGPRTLASWLARDLNLALSQALTIARSELLGSYRAAQLANYRANSDVVQGWVWLAALGSACAACTAMNGTKHSLDEELDSHLNCRCGQAPLTAGWGEILSGLGIDASDLPDTTLYVQSGADWFDDQDAATQRSILGPAKYAAYRQGDLTLADLLGDGADGIFEKTMRSLGLDPRDYLASAVS